MLLRLFVLIELPMSEALQSTLVRQYDTSFWLKSTGFQKMIKCDACGLDPCVVNLDGDNCVSIEKVVSFVFIWRFKFINVCNFRLFASAKTWMLI